jgi:hypothetical protein
MGLSFKGIILILLIITGFSELYSQDIKFRYLNINDGLCQNAVFENRKGQIWILENYLCKLSDVENGIFSRPVHLGLPSFNNSRNS